MNFNPCMMTENKGLLGIPVVYLYIEVKVAIEERIPCLCFLTWPDHDPDGHLW